MKNKQPPAPAQPCIYCGEPVRKIKRGEHVIPEAIGGTRCLRTVCTKCNNTVLADLDRELCSRSPLSIIAALEMRPFLAECWDVDHESGNLLIEARPKDGALIAFPQMILDEKGPELRAHAPDLERVGWRNFESVFVKLMKAAVRRYLGGARGALHLHAIPKGSIPDGYRCPPRAFTRHTVDELFAAAHSEMSFELRYGASAEMKKLLGVIDKWRDGAKAGAFEVHQGSYRPIIGTVFDMGKVCRALFKIGFQLVAEFCDHTVVDRTTFAEVVPAVLGVGPSQTVRWPAGFVLPAGLAMLHGDANAHGFRLVHDGKHWQVYMAFFGGRICAVASFPGPTAETWSSADIHVPLRSDAWTIKTSPILQPLKVQIVWEDIARLVPSVPMNTLSSKMIRRAKM